DYEVDSTSDIVEGAADCDASLLELRPGVRVGGVQGKPLADGHFGLEVEPRYGHADDAHVVLGSDRIGHPLPTRPVSVNRDLGGHRRAPMSPTESPLKSLCEAPGSNARKAYSVRLRIRAA